MRLLLALFLLTSLLAGCGKLEADDEREKVKALLSNEVARPHLPALPAKEGKDGDEPDTADQPYRFVP